MLPVHRASRNGVCSVESAEQVETTSGLQMISRGSTLLTDGARAYPALAKKYRLHHLAVSHCRGAFSKTKMVWRSRKSFKLNVHTGSVDNLWPRLKKCLQLVGQNSETIPRGSLGSCGKVVAGHLAGCMISLCLCLDAAFMLRCHQLAYGICWLRCL